MRAKIGHLILCFEDAGFLEKTGQENPRIVNSGEDKQLYASSR